MRLPVRIRGTISLVILGTSGILWVLLLMDPGGLLAIHHCPVTVSGPSRASLQMLLAMNPISSLLAGWTLMAAAMMLPKLVLPVRHIYARSSRRRRFGAASIFVCAYLGVWVLTGIFMIGAILALNLLMPKSYFPAAGIGIVTIVWQFSPIKQYSLNRGHDHKTLAAFGWPANRDALLFGITHGFWCVASGWALMLFPMLLPYEHNFAMIAASFVMISEHLEHPRLPRWRANFGGRLIRAIFFQTRIRLLPPQKLPSS